MAEYKINPNPRGRAPENDPRGRGWTISAFFAVLLLTAAALIFWSAGPDRTRTADVNNSNAAPAKIGTSQPAESGIPPSGQDAPRTTPAPQVAPQKSNPAGTQ